MGPSPDGHSLPPVVASGSSGDPKRLGEGCPPNVPMGKTSPCVVMTSCCTLMGRSTHTLVGGPHLCHKESSKLTLESRLDLSF